MALSTGTRLGPYEILAPLGAGGMGEVYRAHDARIQREVALKVLPDDLVRDVERRQRFEREAHAAGTLQHPNVLAVYDVGVDGGRPYLVSELLSGESLRSALRSGTLPVRKALDYTMQIARGLAAAHEKGVVHRDIKPENLFVTNEGRLCILDFGVAKVAEAADACDKHAVGATPSWHTDPGTRLGTSAYMSPEQVCGEGVDARSDIFSLGCVLYELLTGRAPFMHATPFETFAAIVATDAPPLRRHRPEVPTAVERIVLRCLEKRRGERFQSAHDLALALEAVGGLDDQPDAHDAGPPPKASHAWRPWVGGAALVALGLSLGAMLWHRTSADLAWTPHQLTSDPGWEAEPALSPGGESVAYVSDRGGAPDLWLMQASGGEPLRLTSDEAREHSPAWFPDGNALAFVSNRDGRDAIYKIPRLGGKPVLLVLDAQDPAVSPDGTRVAFVQRLRSGLARVAVVELTDPSRVHVLAENDASLFDHQQPAWSPDGRWLCHADFRDLWVVPAAGGPGRRLTMGQGIDRRPVWAPDGRSIYFASYREGTQALWRIPVGGGPARRVTFGTGPEGEPSLSRDGRRLAYSTFVSNPDIVLLDLKSGGSQRVGGVLEEGSPAISPDGTRLVYSSDRDGSHDLWQQLLENGRPRGEPARLTDLPGSESTPAFSRDGRWLAYSRALRGRRDIWIQPASGGPPVRVTDRAADMHPSWSPDGTRLVFASRRGGQSQIWTLPVAEGHASGPPVPVTSDPAIDLFPVFLGDSSTIAFVRFGKEPAEVWLERAGGRRPARPLTRGADARFVRWDAASNSLLVSGTWGGPNVSLRRVSAAGGDSRSLDRTVVFGPPSAIGDFDVSADATFVAFVVEESRGDVWLLEARNRP